MPEATSQPRISPAPLRWALAPLRLLERTRGRKRLALATLYVLILAVAGSFAWWAASLNGLPDVGDPFDVEAFGNMSVPDSENAFTLYRRASAKLRPDSSPSRRNPPLDWSQADEGLRRWVEENGEALALWLEGSRRDRALLIRPKDLRFDSSLEGAQELREFARLALLEASRRQQSGDVAGAWELYRGVLRSSRHSQMGGCGVQRIIGVAMLRLAIGPIDSWAADPRVDAVLLRRALADVRHAEASTPPASVMTRAEYLSLMAALDDPPPMLWDDMWDEQVWYHHLPWSREFLVFWNREPERSRRVARLLYANWLAYCDRPPSQRRLAVNPGGHSPYRVGPEAPASARVLEPEAIHRWLLTTIWADRFLHNNEGLQRTADAEMRQLATLRVALAGECYVREHGAPPKRLGELVGPYLDALPDGFEPDDTPPAPDAKSKP